MTDIEFAASSAIADDTSLLRKHAPILRLDRRELFRPIAVDRYVDACDLVVDGTVIRPASMAAMNASAGVGSYLRFIDDHERSAVGAEDVRRLANKILAGRLGHVGLFGRLLDAMFRLTLLVRPTVPKRTTTAAAMKVERLAIDRGATCYGRVVRQGEWLVLHYAYFYAMNDWRSSYWGLNDHEADWEQAWVYLDPSDHRPVWVAATSHEHHGADLRRHWSDPTITVVDGHPVLYAAAGSHALFMEPGEYVTRIDVPVLRWTQQLRRHVALAVGRTPRLDDGLGPALGVPFVDAATGDGVEVSEWDIRPMEGAWVEEFRGLWGVDTGDPLQGERGPGGPKFDRDGEIRRSWADPLGFAGMHGAVPPSAAAARVNIDKIDQAVEDLEEEIRSIGRLLPLAHLTQSPAEMDSVGLRLTELMRQRCELLDLRARLERGDCVVEDARSHLIRPAQPLDRSRRRSVLRDGWAVVSVPALSLMLAWLVLSGDVPVLTVSAVISASQMTRLAFGVILTALALALLAVNLREIRHVLRHSGQK